MLRSKYIMIRDTPTDSAARLFNILPDKLRHETDYDKFSKAESV